MRLSSTPTDPDREAAYRTEMARIGDARTHEQSAALGSRLVGYRQNRMRAEVGDLDVAAAVLGVDMADLVKLRRQLGSTHRRRRPSALARLFARKG